MKIGIVGLGFVGLSFAVVLGHRGYSVIGVDTDKNKISSILSKKSPFYEPKLDRMLETTLKKSLKVSTDVVSVASECQLIFITVGTPLSKTGYIDLSKVKLAARNIGSALSKTQNKPTIIIKSTVSPGTTRDIIQPILEKQSRKKTGMGFGLLTNPEFLREGKAIDDTIKPHIVVIGGDDNESITKLRSFYLRLYRKKVPIIVTNSQTAELIKYANNSFLATKISFINQMANICQAIHGTNIDDVARAIGLDPRIGNLFLRAGPGYGGSCLPKDLQTLISFSNRIGNNPTLLRAVQHTNSLQVENVARMIKNVLGSYEGKRITILGLSFKEDSDDIRESASIKIIKLLQKRHAKITVHDPKAIGNTERIFGDSIRYSQSVHDALKGSECAVIMTPWNEYRKITNKDIVVMKRRIIIDSRRQLDKDKIKAEYHAVGLG
ncbi:MAG: hypothetical protein AUH84_00445 [Thaumarchaeota archaeon 13_1_40CM_4_38_7]|nr:MAG: hypothetical protein AUH84_00445 [Thaumarchaeota archaeon 13_1_40CM_4_38_7]OLC93032.1 MAG: hypothetical protein AUI92_03805 [Thaumarchaeota archaeon 13_1_40CM_3_38_6]